MSIVLIAAFAVACILTGVETFIAKLGKFRGLIPLILGPLTLINLSCPWKYLGVYSLAVIFISLSLTLFVEQLFNTAAEDLPKRIPPR